MLSELGSIIREVVSWQNHIQVYFIKNSFKSIASSHQLRLPRLFGASEYSQWCFSLSYFCEHQESKVGGLRQQICSDQSIKPLLRNNYSSWKNYLLDLTLETIFSTHRTEDVDNQRVQAKYSCREINIMVSKFHKWISEQSYKESETSF